MDCAIVTMKLKHMLFGSLCLAALPVWAQTTSLSIEESMKANFTREWHPHTAYWRGMLERKPESHLLRLGGARLEVRGPLVEPFYRRRPATADETVEARLRRIPVLNLIIPFRMPRPPTGPAKYFRWGEREESWTSLVSWQPTPGLFSFGW